jgi:hypothetical protein
MGLEGHHGKEVGRLIRRDQGKRRQKLQCKYIIVGSRHRLHAGWKERQVNSGVMGTGHGRLERL